MVKCSNCGTVSKTKPITNADMQALGIPVLITQGITGIYCAKCKSFEMAVPKMAELVAAAASILAVAPFKLNGLEIKFLRKSLGLPAKGLAELLGVAAETISRWENEKQVIGDAQERLLRIQVASKLASEAQGVNVSVDEVLSLKISPFRANGAKVFLWFDDDPQSELLPRIEGRYKRA